eukprot:CAMPEP_0115138252 /NCGR_PEP_ID=MMETSP0227-20121206/57544_1 /TAXON_ID=89957 /ORGANISM="Polarella glacialis, Strain CCMP 1383" /LENGTH=106 /DNA_ID=CAMNT_0002545813 /DNA_START=10 /DNA_END=327 /DNA_ORIENTATION=-
MILPKGTREKQQEIVCLAVQVPERDGTQLAPATKLQPTLLQVTIEAGLLAGLGKVHAPTAACTIRIEDRAPAPREVAKAEGQKLPKVLETAVFVVRHAVILSANLE